MTELTRRVVTAGVAAGVAAAKMGVTAAEAAAGDHAVGLPSSQFQFLPTLEETVAMAKEAGFDAIEWNVRDGGHVTPANVLTELPKAVSLSNRAGLKTQMICTAIQDAGSPHAEDILKAMQACGIRGYRSSNYFRYDYALDVAAQLEALRPRLASIAALNRRYGTTIFYHTHSALVAAALPGNAANLYDFARNPSAGLTDLVGGPVWDFWTLMRDMDPAEVAINHDTAHTTISAGNDWRAAAYLCRRHIGGVAVKDFNWRKNPPGSPVHAQDEMCPLGEGLVDLRRRFAFLKEIGFAGPINIHYEHHGMLAPLLDGVGKAKPPAPRAEFVRLLSADLLHLRAVMKETGFSV
jgi:sugar phosphate isomerase/epimerase